MIKVPALVFYLQGTNKDHVYEVIFWIENFKFNNLNFAQFYSEGEF